MRCIHNTYVSIQLLITKFEEVFYVKMIVVYFMLSTSCISERDCLLSKMCCYNGVLLVACWVISSFWQFRNAEDASVALVQMNGFPLAGRPLKVGRSERSASFPDVSEADRISVLMAASSSSGSDPLAAATAAASIIGSLPQLQDPLVGEWVGW